MPKKVSRGRAEASIICVNVAPRRSKETDSRPLDRDLSESESILPLLNDKLTKQQLTLHLPDYGAYRRHWQDTKGRTRLWMGGRKKLYRQFRYEDGTAGRLYGHFVQHLPGNVRPYLQIDRQPVVEADYSAAQLVMLYADHGLPAPEGDLYELTGGSRDIMKTVLTNSVGNATKDETVQSLRKAFLGSGINPERAEARYDQFWSVHRAVCPHNSEDEAPWSWLQNIDSEIVLRVLRLLYDQDIHAIPVHDSFIVKARCKDVLIEAMQQAWKERYPNTRIGIKITDVQSDSV